MKTITLRYYSRFRGFTLTELLLVIMIVSILAAVFIPVFANARNQRNVSCLSNTERLTTAYSLYTRDYDETDSRVSRQLLPYLSSNGLSTCPNLPAIGEQKYTHIRGNPGYAGGTHGRNPNMTYHNGTIMKTAVTGAIFWGTSWASYTGDKITGIDSFYTGFSNSNYSKTSDEYSGFNGQVGPGTTHLGHIVDTTTASGGSSTSAILAEVCRKVTPDSLGNGYYAVYTDVPRGNAGYCAWHSYGSCNGVPVQFAFFFTLDGDAGCNPGDTSGLHSQGLAALANVSAHELSEARTDPTGGGWYDGSGAENGDKCAWTFGAPLVAFSNGSQWKVQGEWSNAAYTAGTGYPNSSGQKGCLTGN